MIFSCFLRFLPFVSHYRRHYHVIVEKSTFNLSLPVSLLSIGLFSVCFNFRNRRSFAKLHSISSTFATNYRHLCYKYELVQSDWHSGLAHLLGKVKMKYQNKNSQNCPANMSIIRELCDIRDGRHIACDIISKTEVCSLLDIICTE